MKARQTKLLRDSLLLEVLVQLGLRTTEASRLEWEHVSLEDSTLHAGEGKRKRKLKIPAKLARKLSGFRQAHAQAKHVFHRKGQPLTARQVQKIVKKRTGKTGKQLRKEFAKGFLEKNPASKLARILGNTTLQSVIPYLGKG